MLLVPTRAQRPSATMLLAWSIGPLHSKIRMPARSRSRYPNPGEVAHQRHIAGAREQQPNVHPVLLGQGEHLEESRRRNQVGIHDPEAPPGSRRQILEYPVGPLLPGNTDDDAHRRVTGRSGVCGVLILGEGRTREAPHMRERQVQGVTRRTLDVDRRVPPWRDAPIGVSRPFIPDAEPADDRLDPVGHDQLAVIARDDPEGAEWCRWVEAANLDAGCAQESPESPAGADAAKPVIQHPDRPRRRAHAWRAPPRSASRSGPSG